MKKLPFSLGIAVSNLKGLALAKANVRVKVPGSKKFIPTQWSEEYQCYVLDQAEPGEYAIKVSRRGYERQERKVFLKKLPTKIHFCLGKKGDRYLYRDGAKIPIPIKDRIIGGMMPGDGSRKSREAWQAKLRKALGKKGEKLQVLTRADAFQVVMSDEISDKEVGAWLKKIRNLKGMGPVGIVIGDANGSLNIALNQFLVRFKPEISRKDIDKILKDHQAASIVPFKIAPNVFLVGFPEVMGMEFFELQEKLNNLDSVISVMQDTLSQVPEHAINPNDFHWPSQWDKHQMEVGDAWQLLNDNLDLPNPLLPQRKFGAANISIAILDSGIKTNAGAVDNIDLQGNLTVDADATLDALIEPTTSMVMLKDASDFAVGNLVAIGADTGLEIFSKVGNEIEVGPLRSSHKANSEVVNETNAAAVSFLVNDEAAHTNKFNVTLTSGGPFHEGYELNIEGLNSADWEMVKIIQVDPGPELTTTPISKSHAGGMVVNQGRKVFRVIDFHDASFTLHNDNITSTHGTRVATVASAKADNGTGIAGVAPNVKILGGEAKLSSAVNTLSAFSWVAGIAPYASGVNQLDHFYEGVDIANASLGYGDPNPRIQLIDDGMDLMVRRGRKGKGLLYFISSGNEDQVMPAGLWTTYDKILTVGATGIYLNDHGNANQADDTTFEHFSQYSNYSDVGATPNVLVDFCGPSNHSDFDQPWVPGNMKLLSGTFSGEGNLINSSSGSTTVSSPMAVKGTTMDGAQPAGTLTIKVDAGTVFADYAVGEWLMLGDVKRREWVKIALLKPLTFEMDLVTATADDHVDGELVAKLPRNRAITRSIFPGEARVYVSNEDGFEAGDWVCLGREGTAVHWAEVAGLHAASNRLNITGATAPAGYLQTIGFDDDEDVKLAYTVGAGGATNIIELNVAFANAAKYVKQYMLVRVTLNGGGTVLRRVNAISAGTVGGYTATRLTLNANVGAAASGGNQVFIPKKNIEPFVIGSSDVKVVSNAGFAADSWVRWNTPGNIPSKHEPRMESSHVHSTFNLAGDDYIRVSGPYSNHAFGTDIHRGVDWDFDDSFSGTSGASPQAAGLAALILTAKPTLTWVEVRHIMRDTADKFQIPWQGYDVPRLGVGRWMNSDGDFIYNDNTGAGMTAAGIANPAPVYSDVFGFGRINAKEAVTAALAYTHNERDLYIRDYMEILGDGSADMDDGISATNLALYKIHSPDIWCRTGYAAAGDQIPNNFYWDRRLPPHQNAAIAGDRSIYFRVRNRGNADDSLQAWARVYLMHTSGAPDLNFPGYFDDTLAKAGYLAGDSGVYFYDEVKLYDISAPLNDETGNPQPVLGPDGGIPADSAYTFHLQWDQADKPPLNTHKKTYVVVEILPYDGPLTGTSVHENGNISFRRIPFTEVRIFENIVAEPALPEMLEFNPAAPTKDFKVTIRDHEYMPKEHLKIVMRRESNTGGIDEVTFAWDTLAGAWQLDAPIADFVITPPVVTPGGAGLPDLYAFEGTFTYRATDNKISLKAIVMEPAEGEEDHLNPVDPLVVRYEESAVTQLYSVPVLPEGAGGDIGPSKTPRIHVFADMSKLDQQNDPDKAFHEDSLIPDQLWRTTSTFNPNVVAPDPVNAYAVTTGRVFIQQANATTVNLFLAPLVQSGIGFTSVKYFVYRGLRLEDFLKGPTSPDNEEVRAKVGAGPFITDLYDQVDERNNAQSPVGTDTLTPVAFGWDPDNQLDPERTIDDFFFNPGTGHELPVITKGAILGTFLNDALTDEIGFEIILNDGSFLPSLEYARATEYLLDATGLGSIFELKERKEQLLSFVDPAAYYGMHYFSGVEVPGNPPIDENDLYTKVVEKFQTRNTVYLDVRNENGYSYNYYDNYTGAVGNEDRILYRASSLGNYNALKYERDGWPIHTLSGVFIEQGDFGLGYYKLRLNDNIDPVLYIENGTIFTPKTNPRFIADDLLKEAGNTVTTREFAFIWPKVVGSMGVPFRFTSTYVKLLYGRKLPTMPDPDNDVVKTENYTDNLFGPLEAVIQSRGIDALDAGNDTFKLDGNYESTLKANDVIQVVKSDAGTNDGVFTVNTVTFNLGANQTEIKVNESVAAGAAPFGFLNFSYHLWNIDLPTRWFSSSRKSFVDAIDEPQTMGGDPVFGFGFMANTGQALDNGRIVFYASPYHFLQRGGEDRTVNTINLIGGAGSAASIWTEIIKQNPRLQLSGTSLKLAASTYVPVFEFEQTDEDGGNERKENFLALCISDAEFNQVKKAVFESDLSEFHDRYFKLKNPVDATDMNGIDYIQYELWVTGWEHKTGPESVDYLEVNSLPTGAASVVSVYARKDNPLIFSSKDFAALEILEPNKESFDEEQRSEQLALDLLASDPTMAGLVSAFAPALNGIDDEISLFEGLVDTYGQNMFDQAVSNSLALDSRPLYWARMHVRAAIKAHAWMGKQRKLSREIIDRFESESRGIGTVLFTNANPAFSGVNFTTAKKVLVVGFDPDELDPKTTGNIENTSSSGVSALALHNEVLSMAGSVGAVQSVVLPIRYNDYSKDYLSELFKSYLDGPDAVDMILLLGENDNQDHFDVECFAAKAVSSAPDNAGLKKKNTRGFGRDRFLESRLPVNDIVLLGSNPRIYLDQSHESSGGNVAHPVDGGPDVDALPGVLPTGKPVQGSAGSFIYNQLFYQLMKAHKRSGSSAAAGLITLPKPGASWANMGDIKTAVSEAIKRSLGSL